MTTYDCFFCSLFGHFLMHCPGTKAGDKYFEETGFLDHQFSVPRLEQGIFAVGKGAGTACAGARC